VHRNACSRVYRNRAQLLFKHVLELQLTQRNGSSILVYRSRRRRRSFKLDSMEASDGDKTKLTISSTVFKIIGPVLGHSSLAGTISL
jgi:hypothetical protein